MNSITPPKYLDEKIVTALLKITKYTMLMY